MPLLPPKALIGMVHLAPLPGSPSADWPLDRIIELARADARTLVEAGFDAVMIENFGDAPFRAIQADPHTVASMTRVCRAIKEIIDKPIGINVLRNAAQAALAIATICDASFIRVNVHCGVYATDQGIIEGQADETLRYRRRLNSSVAIFADVHVKHARPLSSASIAEAAEEIAYRGKADALIVSGTATGKPTDLDDLRAVRAVVADRPIFVGSGATTDTLNELLAIADGVIVGTAVKQDGRILAAVDRVRAEQLVRAAKRS